MHVHASSVQVIYRKALWRNESEICKGWGGGGWSVCILNTCMYMHHQYRLYIEKPCGAMKVKHRLAGARREPLTGGGGGGGGGGGAHRRPILSTCEGI